MGVRNIDVHVPRIEKYSENSEAVNWSLIFSRVYKVCLEVKVIEFQYCFLHDLLINYFWLNTWTPRSLCTFCNEEIEDLCHCRFTQLFWTDFFGTANMKESFLIFSAKQIIYISRFAETIPLLHEFKMHIENVKNLEYIITKKNEKWTR